MGTGMKEAECFQQASQLTKLIPDSQKKRFLLYLQSSGFAGSQPWEKWPLHSPGEDTESAKDLSWKNKLPQRGTRAIGTVGTTLHLFKEFEPIDWWAQIYNLHNSCYQV